MSDEQEREWERVEKIRYRERYEEDPDESVAWSGKVHRGTAWNWFYFDFSYSSVDAAIIVVVAILAILGAAFLVYALAFVFTHLLSLGEAKRANQYRRQIAKFDVDEPVGSYLAGKLYRMNFYFSVLFAGFVAEEGVRFFMHTGPATLPIWIFRFLCLALFVILAAVFVGRLRAWLSFKRGKDYRAAVRKIDQCLDRDLEKLRSK